MLVADSIPQPPVQFPSCIFFKLKFLASAMTAQPPHSSQNRVPRWQLMSRALQLLCPRCGRASIIRKWLFMPERCPECRLKLEREPGYYLGSIYINYGLTAVLLTLGYFILFFAFDLPPRGLLWGSLAFAVIFPLLFFPFSRTLWLAFDLAWDPPIEDHA
jgi:uncharacterized protein (DUF983 family)